MRKRYIKEFNTISDYTTFKASLSYYAPNVSYINGTDVVLYNPLIAYPGTQQSNTVKNYLSFTAQENATFQFSSDVYYSLNNGVTWTNLSANTSSPTISTGTDILWKAQLTPTLYGIGTFSSTGNFIAKGNVMSLLYGDSFTSHTSLSGNDFAFCSLFEGCSNIINSSKLLLPTTLSQGCYKNMFKNCTNMVSAPMLSANTLANSCYYGMFYGCTSLVNSPELPASELKLNCYENMFYGCSNVTYIKCLATDITATDCTSNWVNGVANSGVFVKDSTISSWTTGNDGIPTGWGTGVDVDYSTLYLTFRTTETGTFKAKTLLYYSLDDGENWVVLLSDTYTETIPSGSKIIWKANGALDIRFYSTCNFIAEGNVMSLICGDDFANVTTMPNSSYRFYRMFYECKTIIRADNLCIPLTELTNYCCNSMFSGCSNLITTPQLPVTTLTEGCYQAMFQGCTSLTTPPELPATTLNEYCYGSMFQGCTSLTEVPALPATILKRSCYVGMFESCKSLTTAPELPATTLDEWCYYGMFKYCKSLTTAPELPATTMFAYCYYEMFYGCSSLTTAPELPSIRLAEYCYYSMFERCVSLTTAPELPAATLFSHCYEQMFYDCSNLNYIKCLNTSSSTGYMLYWVAGVASNGTFVKSSGTTWPSGSSGIPTNWTVLEE